MELSTLLLERFVPEALQPLSGEWGRGGAMRAAPCEDTTLQRCCA